ncbi:hypothetical protein CCY99_02855 [Helicobacter sp. 16-1353]|uniref:type II secretion system protein n=1 Tax=Helicobacter sp. 16-1353 TaxID=2004996 RepID=UPI000DCCDAA4|nr:type II secretion system protein [Helicobacter sp. 16-1353]RAX54715.1 hypothetical protein CCY99_02855 [Helicobacter sp. 16-1353]
MKRKGFNMIELVFVIVIIGVLTAVAIPRLSLGRDDACYAKLRAGLSETETILSREYTKRFLQGTTMNNNELLGYLKTLEGNNSDGCSFTVNNVNNIVVKVKKDAFALNVTTDTTTKSPTLTCDLDNEMCRKLTGKVKSN